MAPHGVRHLAFSMAYVSERIHRNKESKVATTHAANTSFMGRQLLRGLAILLGLSMPFSMQASAAKAHPPAIVPSVDTDRWLEIDLYWFTQNDIEGSVHSFWDRFQPLFAGVRGYRGVILNVGWTANAIMEWSGNPNQRIWLPTTSGQARWVDENGSLTGTTAERQKQAADRFARSVSRKSKGYDPWTYGDLKRLATELKDEAARRGIASYKVGVLNLAWTNGYGEGRFDGAWSSKHQEAFTPSAPVQSGNFSPPLGHYFDPGARLHADATPLGGLPQGISEGMPVHEAYAAQWGSLSRALGLDAIMLRDSFGMPIPYSRNGPWGPVAPSPAVIHQATDAVAALVKDTKLANPAALVMMYSNGASAVGDWRANGLDLESVAKQGYLDIWVDQTWAGAWNEVGVRDGAFWNSPTQGWTYQLGYMLTHAAILADTKVRHYPLVETFDAWEDWDIIHSAPQRLRWGIWAYSHAAVKTPHGLKMPAGSYISWANQGDRLLSQEDVRFLTDNINAAVTDAHKTTEVFGPTLVYSRDAMQWQIEHATPNHDVNEWIDEQAASVIKWPIPILSSTRLEWIPRVKSDLFVLQTPSHLSPPHLASLHKLILSGQPVAILGRFEGVDQSLLRLASLRASPTVGSGPPQLCAATTRAPEVVKNIAIDFNAYCRPETASASADARVVYMVQDTPRLTLDTSDGRRIVVWSPPDFRSPGSFPLSQIWGNTGAPYALAAGALNDLLKMNSALHVSEIDLRQTMNISAWRISDGTVRVLAANLEDGLRDDADLSRHTTLALPKSWPGAAWKNAWTGDKFVLDNSLLNIDLEQATSALLEPAK
jgi:hypothetical protein